MVGIMLHCSDMNCYQIKIDEAELFLIFRNLGRKLRLS